MGRKITAIPPKMELVTERKKVAAYARVSSGKDAMLHSLSAQISYYSSFIQSHGDWKFSGVYADEAITGTKDNRAEFQRMIADCKAGKIDMVITKSISRFARNTVTLLETVRELKTLGVDVYFEEQNIHSMSGDGELMLTILASFAQEESLSVSENCKWRIRNKFQEGIPNTFYVYGFKKENDEIVVNEAEAQVVKDIVSMYLEGMGSVKIAKELNRRKIPAPRGDKWHQQTVMGILKNEKNMGDMMLQKYYTKDHISKKTLKNDGKLPKVYVRNSHEAIVSKENFDEVQKIITERTSKDRVSREYDFKGVVFCGICGNRYKRKKNYKKYVWVCNKAHTEGVSECSSKQVPESILSELASGFDKEILKIIVLPENIIQFIFEDGSSIEKKWEKPSRKWTDEMKSENYENLRRRHGNE